MLFVYVDMRYQRQLNLICPDVPAAFFRDAGAYASGNGGRLIRLSGGSAWFFEDRSVGYAFSASRFLSDIRSLLEEHRERVRECLVIVDICSDDCTPDSLNEHLAKYENTLFPDLGILISPHALAVLNPYISVVSHQDSQFSFFAGLRLTEYVEPNKDESAGAASRFSLFAQENLHPLFALRDVSATFPDADSSLLSPEDSVKFFDAQAAMNAFCSRRYEDSMPDYLISACHEWFTYRIQMITAACGAPPVFVLYGKPESTAALHAFFDSISGFCAVESGAKGVYLPGNAANMPEDLAELAWLMYRALSCLFTDELPAFFKYLGKDSPFLIPLGTLLYSEGMLSDSREFRTFNRLLIESLRKRLGERVFKLDKTFAGYLWKKYEKGELQPVSSLSKVLETLSFSIPDDFKLNCLLRGTETLESCSDDSCSFSSPEVRESLTEFLKALAAYQDRKIDESAALVRRSLHRFQKAGALSGEYRSLSLIAFLSLVQKKADDSIVYLEYALENAEKMHDPSAVIATRFDMAMVYFVMGNYHFSLCVLDSLDKPVGEYYAKDREILHVFMKGRVQFELGAYRQAELLFQTASALADAHGIPGADPLCRVWYARSIMHQNRFASAESILSSHLGAIPEAAVFLAESALLSGRPLAGFSPAKHPLFQEAVDSKRRLFTPATFDWSSGFALAEDRCYCASGEPSVLERMYSFYQAVWDVRFNSSPDISKLAVLSREALDAKDPWAAVYFYFAWDYGLRAGTVPAADMSVWLSMAFKYMQKRANYISDNGMREEFMQTPTFNSRLWRAARENMLI
ncbi:hypothetical protein K7J14_09125 [Treponema zuelzerae]|uniref:Uncharacterized protein n=1 Tax=Teretinema zuelzerae TaxID=156 RepID=A0AAE3EJZ5_9SPIR|nr:hypothetical protein [Teretinema zuelzerae]MCD1654863.1 hypothetical protein [Teretinema zuelzerae]